MTTSYRLVPLHDCWEYSDRCAALLNSKWKKTDEYRKQSLRQSSDSFPCSLIFLECKGADGDEVLVGHLRLWKCATEPTTLIVTAVIVCKERRGQGLGKLMLTAAEKYAREKGYNSFCLSSKEAGRFYAKCGYKKSTPLQPCLGNKLQDKIDNLFRRATNQVSQANDEDRQDVAGQIWMQKFFQT